MTHCLQRADLIDAEQRRLVRYYYLRLQMGNRAYLKQHTFPFWPNKAEAYDTFLLDRAVKHADEFFVWFIKNTEGEVCGFLQAKSRTGMFGEGKGFIDHLYIMPASRGQGLAPAAMMEAERALKEVGCKALVLSVAQRNRRARRFYESLGWETREQLIQPMRGGQFMEKRLKRAREVA